MKDISNAGAIANSLAGDIHSGVISPKAMLPSERDLCESFNVGRNVIREAITILQGMGLLDQSKGKRPRVVEPTLATVMQGVAGATHFFFSGSEGLAHLEQARLFLETSLVRYACQHATNAQVGKLVEAIDACEKALDDLDRFRDADVRFHRVLAEIPGNPIFTALHDTFVERLMRNRPRLPDIQQSNSESNQAHREIVSAILNKDADQAVDILTGHLTRNYGTYFRLAMEQGHNDDAL
ncbi:FCD domain-containing protein [Alphaproteobacteria bacterium]|jgi:DNA-binding FadR family transcriptional regulator|nr:FCD domain-containing protein [Alphaproteobacteria bacterium]